MDRYVKGAGAERELRKLIEGKGFVVIRSAKSGVDGVSPDLIALKTTGKLALECKAWKGGLHFSNEKVEIMKEWEKKAGIPFYIAWKLNRKGWKFFPLSILKKNESGYSLNSKDFDAGLELESLIQISK
jgi:Holliday junction resolvase